VRFGTAIAAAVLFAGGGFAQDKIDNPEYASWSKFKAGASTTLRTSIATDQVKSETVITTTLVEVGGDKLVLETAVTSKANGMEFKAPPTKRDVPKSIVLPAGAPKPDPAKKPEGQVEEGTEEVKVGGATVKAKWIKNKVKLGEVETESKTWFSDEVPGGLVKSETTTRGPNAATIKMELVEFKKP
jgi:hypothetical protein